MFEWGNNMSFVIAGCRMPWAYISTSSAMFLCWSTVVTDYHKVLLAKKACIWMHEQL